MTDILSNELVRKYFGLENTCWVKGSPQYRAYMAENVLQAMQQPIKKGDRYLRCLNDGKVEECTLTAGLTWDLAHFGDLRLPDHFQGERKECEHDLEIHCKKCEYREWVKAVPSSEERRCIHEDCPKPQPETEKCYACDGINLNYICRHHVKYPPKPASAVDYYSLATDIMRICGINTEGADDISRAEGIKTAIVSLLRRS